MDIVISEETAKSASDRWPAETRDLAYQLWSFVCGRNAAKVAVMLTEQGQAVPERTVQYWASSGEWAKRASDDLGRIAPDIRQQTIAELIYGGLESGRGLRETVKFADKTLAHIDGEIARYEDRLTTAQVDDVPMLQDRLDALYTRAERIIKANVSAHQAMLDRAGFSPVGSNAPELPRVSVADAAKDFRAMSDEERREWQRERVEASRLPAKAPRRKR